MAHLLWDPNQKEDALIQEWHTGVALCVALRVDMARAFACKIERAMADRAERLVQLFGTHDRRFDQFQRRHFAGAAQRGLVVRIQPTQRQCIMTRERCAHAPEASQSELEH